MLVLWHFPWHLKESKAKYLLAAQWGRKSSDKKDVEKAEVLSAFLWPLFYSRGLSSDLQAPEPTCRVSESKALPTGVWDSWTSGLTSSKAFYGYRKLRLKFNPLGNPGFCECPILLVPIAIIIHPETGLNPARDVLKLSLCKLAWKFKKTLLFRVPFWSFNPNLLL